MNIAPVVSAPKMVLIAAICALLPGCGDSRSTPGVSSAAQPASEAVAAGEETYNRYCFSCHAAGLAGAPKVGVGADWELRAAKGSAALLASTVAGITPGMPPRGLCNSCSDAELAGAIDHMLNKSGVAATP